MQVMYVRQSGPKVYQMASVAVKWRKVGLGLNMTCVGLSLSRGIGIAQYGDEPGQITREDMEQERPIAISKALFEAVALAAQLWLVCHSRSSVCWASCNDDARLHRIFHIVL